MANEFHLLEIDLFNPVEPVLPTKELKSFHWADWLVFGLFLLISLGVGVYQGFMARKKVSMEDFLLGNRNLAVFPVALSVLTSFLSAITILGTPAEIYMAGTEYWMSIWGSMIACLEAAFLFVPLLYPLKLTSSYEYLERRFKSKAAKLTGTLILILKELLYMGVVLYSPATALEAVTGFPEWASIVIGGVIAILYVALGGMKASVWTSVFQAAIMVAGVVAILIKGCYDMGGIENVWMLNWETGRINFFNFDPNPLVRHTFWTLVVGNSFVWLSSYGTNQASVQRFSAVSSMSKAKAVILISVPGLFVMVTICALSGMVVFSWYYYVQCDILRAGYVSNSNQIVAYYVMDRLGYPTVPGLFLACLFSGALSTMSSSCGACAAVTWEDAMKWKLDHLSESTKTLINKALVILFGGLGIGMAFMSANLGGTVLQAALSFNGAAGGPMLGLFLLGGLFPCANWIGAVIGGFVGLAFPLWISFGAYTINVGATYLNSSTEMCYNFTLPNATDPPPQHPDDITGISRLYLLSYLWYSAIGAATCVVLGLLISMITGFTDPDCCDPRYHLPLFDWVFCCLPNKSLSVLRCKLDRSTIEEEKVPINVDLDVIVVEDDTEEKEKGVDNPLSYQDDEAKETEDFQTDLERDGSVNKASVYALQQASNGYITQDVTSAGNSKADDSEEATHF